MVPGKGGVWMKDKRNHTMEGEAKPTARFSKRKERKKGPVAMEDLQNDESSSFLKEVINIVLSVVIAYILFVVIRTFLFFPFQVVGESMYPTLQTGDRLILNRLGTIDRFDVVVFPAPDHTGEEYVKRVIGVPGDEITYYQDNLYVNGELMEEPYLDSMKEVAGDRQLTNDFTLYELSSGEAATVPQDMYFVMGDNRWVSKDSREFGFVPAEMIEGTATLRIWPLDRFGFLEENE